MGQGDFDNWWQKSQSKVSRFDNLDILHIPTLAIEQLSAMVDRTMELQCTIDNGEMWLTDGQNEATVNLQSVYPL